MSRQIVTLIAVVCLFSTSPNLASSFAAFQDVPAEEGDVETAQDEEVFEDRWTDDFDNALAQARKEKKDLLLLFTGSDWCPPCKQLEDEVLGVEDFQFEAVRHYVLVKLDFPKDTQLPDKVVKQNEGLAKRYGVEGYPTVICVDIETKPFAITGYQDGGVNNYLAVLEDFRQLRIERDKNLSLAKNAKGIERAKLLNKAIEGMDEQVISVYYEEIVNEIVELDKDDEAGLRSKWNAQKESDMRKIIMTDILMISRLEKPEKAINFIDDVLEQMRFPADEKISVLQIKLNLVRKLNDPAKLDSVLDEMINLEGAETETRERLLVKKIVLMIGSGRREAALKLLDESIVEGQDNMHLLQAKGDIFEAAGEYKRAISAYDLAIKAASNAPDVLVNVVGAKADVLFAMERIKEAMQVLDNFAEDTNMPSDLRSATLLHKAIMMRESDRRRQARLAENRAVEIAQSPNERAEVEKLVQRLRSRFGEQ